MTDTKNAEAWATSAQSTTQQPQQQQQRGDYHRVRGLGARTRTMRKVGSDFVWVKVLQREKRPHSAKEGAPLLVETARCVEDDSVFSSADVAIPERLGRPFRRFEESCGHDVDPRRKDTVPNAMPAHNNASGGHGHAEAETQKLDQQKTAGCHDESAREAAKTSPTPLTHPAVHKGEQSHERRAKNRRSKAAAEMAAAAFFARGGPPRERLLATARRMKQGAITEIFLRGVRGARGRGDSNGSGDSFQAVEIVESINVEEDFNSTRVIASGTFGEIVSGRHRDLDKDVAVKVARDTVQGKATQRLEAMLLARLANVTASKKRHIVRVIGIDDARPTCPIMMPVAVGDYWRVLEGVVKIAYDFNDTLRFAKEILLGLSFLHDNGIVHCDFKLANVLVYVGINGKYSMKVTDLGLAKAFGEMRGYLTGSVGYIPPESFKRQSLARPEQDVFSAGVGLVLMVIHPSMMSMNIFATDVIFTDNERILANAAKAAGTEALAELKLLVTGRALGDDSIRRKFLLPKYLNPAIPAFLHAELCQTIAETILPNPWERPSLPNLISTLCLMRTRLMKGQPSALMCMAKAASAPGRSDGARTIALGAAGAAVASPATANAPADCPPSPDRFWDSPPSPASAGAAAVRRQPFKVATESRRILACREAVASLGLTRTSCASPSGHSGGRGTPPAAVRAGGLHSFRSAGSCDVDASGARKASGEVLRAEPGACTGVDRPHAVLAANSSAPSPVIIDDFHVGSDAGSPAVRPFRSFGGFISPLATADAAAPKHAILDPQGVDVPAETRAADDGGSAAAVGCANQMTSQDCEARGQALLVVISDPHVDSEAFTASAAAASAIITDDHWQHQQPCQVVNGFNFSPSSRTQAAEPAPAVDVRTSGEVGKVCKGGIAAASNNLLRSARRLDGGEQAAFSDSYGVACDGQSAARPPFESNHSTSLPLEESDREAALGATKPGTRSPAGVVEGTTSIPETYSGLRGSQDVARRSLAAIAAMGDSRTTRETVGIFDFCPSRVSCSTPPSRWNAADLGPAAGVPNNQATWTLIGEDFTRAPCPEPQQGSRFVSRFLSGNSGTSGRLSAPGQAVLAAAERRESVRSGCWGILADTDRKWPNGEGDWEMVIASSPCLGSSNSRAGACAHDAAVVTAGRAAAAAARAAAPGFSEEQLWSHSPVGYVEQGRGGGNWFGNVIVSPAASRSDVPIGVEGNARRRTWPTFEDQQSTQPIRRGIMKAPKTSGFPPTRGNTATACPPAPALCRQGATAEAPNTATGKGTDPTAR